MRKKEIKERLIECLRKRMEKRIRRRKENGKLEDRFALFFFLNCHSERSEESLRCFANAQHDEMLSS